MKKNQLTVNQLMVLIPSDELKEMRNAISGLKEAIGKQMNVNPLGDWIREKEAQEVIGRKGTVLWRLRRDGKIVSSKIGSKCYYSRESIINFLNENTK